AGRVVDGGGGGGETVRSTRELTMAGAGDGVDYAPASVAVARQTNADFIASGLVAVQQASISRLPFSDGSFDLITAVETHYYWPDLPGDLREARRVLTPHGRLIVIADAYQRRHMA